MSHNPILKHVNLGLIERLTVEKDTIAVLFKNQRFEREAAAGERIGNTQADIVDIAPQTLVWRAELPAKDQNDFFPFTITLRYAVSDPYRMVKDRVTDTEALLETTLQQALRNTTRAYRLNQHAALEPELEQALTNLDLNGLCGLTFLAQPDAVLNLSERTQARIKELDRIEKAMRLPQTAVHGDDFPSKEAAYRFRVNVNVQYRVTDAAELPYDTLAQAEEQLWPRIQRALRRASRDYEVVDIARAETAMQDALDDVLDGSGIRGFGLEITAVDVSADLDQSARQRYVELAEIQHKAALETARLNGMKANTTFFSELIKQGSWAVLAVAVSKGEVSMEDLYQRMTQSEQQKLAMQVDLLKTLRQDNSRDEAQDYDIAKVLLHTVASQALGSQAPGLAAPPATPQLPDSSKTAGGGAS